MKTHVILLLLGLVLLAGPAFSQRRIRSIQPDLQSLPGTIIYEGTVVFARQWKDRIGEHLFIATETGVYETVDSASMESSRAGRIQAQHFLLGDTIKRSWEEGDSIVACMVDTELGFLPSAFELTDLDKDGIYELWLMYKSVCHGDVSPADMQLVMHEGDQRFTMIGTTKVEIGDKQFLGGQYDFNNLFLEGNPVFKKHGMDLWNDHLRG